MLPVSRIKILSISVVFNTETSFKFIFFGTVQDPRDMLWKNINAERGTTERRHTLVQTLLVVGLFLWGTYIWITCLGHRLRYLVVAITGAFVTYLQGKTKEAVERIGILPKGVMTGYLPTAIISLVLIYLPHLFSVLAVRVIRFKSVSM